MQSFITSGKTVEWKTLFGRVICIQAPVPESYATKNNPGRSSDLLSPGSLPVPTDSGMRIFRKYAGLIHPPELTASGNVQDFHLVPFSSRKCGIP